MATSTNRRTSSSPLWQQVSHHLELEIAEGTCAPDGRLDSEAELCRRFGVSRVTLRMALSHLEQRGLLHPEAGRGWFLGEAVSTRPVSEDPGVLQSFTEMAESRGLVAGARVLHCVRRPADWSEAEELGIAPGAEVLSLRRLRLLDGIPVAVDHSLVVAGLMPDADATTFTDSSLYSALRRHGVHPYRADYEVHATAADDEQARLLGVEVGAPLLSAHQICVDESGRRIERGHIIYRGDRYRFRAVLQI